MGEQQRAAAHAGRRQARFRAGVATAYHDHIESLLELHLYHPPGYAVSGPGLYVADRHCSKIVRR
jgi:hypothetical protein